jgi:hypothetical protein
MSRATPNERTATLRSWRAAERKERTLRKVSVVFRDPEQLFEDARARLMPDWNVIKVTVALRLARPDVTLDFGTAQNGVSKSITIALLEHEAQVVALYLLARTASPSGLIIGTPLPSRQDDDGGEELSVPTVSEGLMAQMSSGRPH